MCLVLDNCHNVVWVKFWFFNDDIYRNRAVELLKGYLLVT